MYLVPGLKICITVPSSSGIFPGYCAGVHRLVIGWSAAFTVHLSAYVSLRSHRRVTIQIPQRSFQGISLLCPTLSSFTFSRPFKKKCPKLWWLSCRFACYLCVDRRVCVLNARYFFEIVKRSESLRYMATLTNLFEKCTHISSWFICQN